MGFSAEEEMSSMSRRARQGEAKQTVLPGGSRRCENSTPALLPVISKVRW